MQPAASESADPTAGSQAASKAQEVEIPPPVPEQVAPGPEAAQPETEAEDGILVQAAIAGSTDELAGSMTGSLAGVAL